MRFHLYIYIGKILVFIRTAVKSDSVLQEHFSHRKRSFSSGFICTFSVKFHDIIHYRFNNNAVFQAVYFAQCCERCQQNCWRRSNLRQGKEFTNYRSERQVSLCATIKTNSFSRAYSWFVRLFVVARYMVWQYVCILNDASRNM